MIDEEELFDEIEEEFNKFKAETRYKRLNIEQYVTLQEQYCKTPHIHKLNADKQFYPAGEHVKLRFILNQFGYYPNDRFETMEIAENLLCLEPK